jgi:protein-S-isoprenylcysteine O-methyltransferase Ste14
LITLGWLMVSLGLLLMTAAVLTLWRHRTTVNPFGRARTLCVTGPFAWSRNPIYLADFLVLLGGGWVLNSVWPAVLAPAIGWLIRHHVVAHEEAFLSAEFGPAYDDYLARVNRWFGRKKTPAQGRG